jgi:hypothetical protein
MPFFTNGASPGGAVLEALVNLTGGQFLFTTDVRKLEDISPQDRRKPEISICAWIRPYKSIERRKVAKASPQSESVFARHCPRTVRLYAPVE